MTEEQRAEDDTTLSPQDFYREMVERPDVRRVLARLAQITASVDDRSCC